MKKNTSKGNKHIMDSNLTSFLSFPNYEQISMVNPGKSSQRRNGIVCMQYMQYEFHFNFLDTASVS